MNVVGVWLEVEGWAESIITVRLLLFQLVAEIINLFFSGALDVNMQRSITAGLALLFLREVFASHSHHHSSGLIDVCECGWLYKLFSNIQIVDVDGRRCRGHGSNNVGS
jgi:hypothetical protein